MESLLPRALRRSYVLLSGRESRPGAEEELGRWLEEHRYHLQAIGVDTWFVPGRVGALVYRDAAGDLVVQTRDHYLFPAGLDELGRLLHRLAL